MVVAMNLRKFASEKVTVSVDGKRFSWIHHDLIQKKLNEKDLKTIYLEKHGSEKMNEHYIREFICSPLFQNHITKIHVHSNGLYAFIEFTSAEHANEFVKLFTWKSIDSAIYSSWVENRTSAINSKNRRVMLKSEWNARMQEYYESCQNHYTHLGQNPTNSKSFQENKLEFQSGVIAIFSGAHPETTSKTIKKLIEMVAPVAFVDYNSGELEGYVRFKNWRDALLAQSYFSRAYINQQSGSDCSGVLKAHESRHHYRKWIRHQEMHQNFQHSSNNPFSLRILEGKDEELYWNQIFEWQSYAKEKYQDDGLMEVVEPDQVEMEKKDFKILDYESEINPDTKDVPQSRKKSKKVKSTHVVFKDSDEESDKEHNEESHKGHNEKFDKELDGNVEKGLSIRNSAVSTINAAENGLKDKSRKPRHRKRKLESYLSDSKTV